MQFEESVRIDSPMKDVFNFIADGEKASQWNSAVRTVEKVTDGPVGQGTRYHMVRRLPWGLVENEYEITEYVPYTRITIRSLSGPTPFLYTYNLATTDGITMLTLDGEGDTSDITHLPGFIMKTAVKRGVRENLEKLKEILEGR